MSCAADRKPPSNEYLLLDEYPPSMIAYTLGELKAKISRTPMLRSAIQYWTLYQRPIGMTVHERKAAATAMVGAMTYMILSVFAGMKLSLNASFTPSAASCIRPYGPTRLGPGRLWIRPSATRSNQTV